ncbi:related to phosphatidylglycerol/phosphatidylinositol transfer protein [Rhynchosporium agropyri]|uniref:Phosphatidylglycerol/phosphatidylinositol transfer protein n=1 Tax=Rhynchosporium agropyri TaxID=914238 RepID=A0A1E1LCI2_9HELO|nr:related to phosphatidylglycerol/phosphatidylinositol transfer protein [Rhynchosporium agropyri]
MKSCLSIISLLCSSLVAVEGYSVFGGSQKVLGGAAVPGDNPLTFCQLEHDDDIFTLENVDLTPNPPKAGEPLYIKASGTLKRNITENDNAVVDIVVKYGFIKLLSTQAKLCEQIKNVDMECPIEKGPITITKEVALPKEIPPGKYNVHANAITMDADKNEKDHITCLEATVQFGG